MQHKQWYDPLYTMDKRIILFLIISVILLHYFMTHRYYYVAFNLSLHPEKTTRTNSEFSPKFSSSSFNIAIIGSSGYIGSRLLQHLSTEKNWAVIGYDRIFSGQASHEISTKDLHKFRVVIYLGGLTNHAACHNRSNDVEHENVDDILKLTKRMLPSQLLIFASTSAIAEGSDSNLFEEDSPVQPHLFDSYVASLLRRENALRNLSLTLERVPQIVGLRLGTVIGLSSRQRIDFPHMTFVCQAFLSGKIDITHPETTLALLSMEDLIQAVIILIKESHIAERFDLFHLQSFSANISNIANTIAWRSGAHIHAWDHSVKDDRPGFSLNINKFTNTFDFVFQGNQDDIISQLIDDVPRMCLGQQSRLDKNSTRCVVCGSHIMHTILDLHSQPLANDFRTANSTACERFPLRLVRCPKCHHIQLSHIVDRKHLSSHDLYQNDTSQSLKTYFAWLAEKIIDERSGGSGTVLQIASNNGSQLNEFSTRGWRTFGVDSAKDLVQLARVQNHTVFTGSWGVDTFPDLPPSDSLDVIIAHNILAHVENPVHFLRACAVRMSMNTRLYIQTPQYEMHETGQFDAIYHERISFFTAHSFQTIASLVGLKIVNFEIISIHGRSCLVTFQRTHLSNISFTTTFQKEAVPSFAAVLQKERDLGMTEAWFYLKYQARALAMRQWIARQLTILHAQGHTIVAYGAVAKGMVLLHFLLEIPNRSWNISYVVDDASSKQNTYCPGTLIPVYPTAELSKHNPSTPLTIVVFAWNFWDEISKKIRQETVKKNINKVFVVLPFPQQQLIRLNANADSKLTQNAYQPLSWPLIFPSPRRPVILISHFYNEELLLPFWIRHHAPMFDMTILIDYNSTDRSCEIIRSEAPSSWRIVPSRNQYFMSIDADQEVMDYEKMYPTAWKIALNIPEFLVHQNLRGMLADMDSTIMVLRFRSIFMTGNDSRPLERFTSLLKQRSVYVFNPRVPEERLAVTWFSRYMHRHSFGIYKPGRHMVTVGAWNWAPVGFIAKYMYTPWPEIMKRKLQIRTRILPEEFAKGWATYHNVNADQLTRTKQSTETQTLTDLQDFDASSDELAMVHRVWRERIDVEGQGQCTALAA